MTPMPEARAALLNALAGVLARHPGDPERVALEAMRLLRAAGMTWCDVLGPIFAPDDYSFLLLLYAPSPVPRPHDYGRTIQTFMAHATPGEAATAAVLANKPDLTPAETQLLVSIAWKLIGANAAAAEIQQPTAQRMI